MQVYVCMYVYNLNIKFWLIFKIYFYLLVTCDVREKDKNF